MTRAEKIILLKQMRAGSINIEDLAPKQLNIFIQGDSTIYKIDETPVTFEELREQWEKQFKIGCYWAGEYLHLFQDGVMQF